MIIKKTQLQALMAAVLMAAGANIVSAQSPIIIDFTSQDFTGLTALNSFLGPHGVSADAGVPDSISDSSGGFLAFQTDPGAADMLFNFSQPVSSVSVETWPDGNPVGITAFSVNTTAVGALSLPGGDVVGGETLTGGATLTVSGLGIRSIQLEDPGAFMGLYNLSFTPAPTPEPATFGLLALGGVLLAGARRLRARK